MFRGGSGLCRFENLTLVFFGLSLPNVYQGSGQKGQGREGDQGLEEQTRAIPAKMCSLEVLVARLSGWLEAL